MTADRHGAGDTRDGLTIGQLWRRLSLEQRQAMLTDFWEDEESADQQVEALAVLVQRLKFRPKTVRTLPVEKRVKYLAGMSGLPDSVAARALVAHHFRHRRPMMATFLDTLGLAHEEGLISEEVVKPDPQRIDAAVAAIAAAHPRDEVALYLCTLAAQDPEAWGSLASRPEAQLPAES